MNRSRSFQNLALPNRHRGKTCLATPSLVTHEFPTSPLWKSASLCMFAFALLPLVFPPAERLGLRKKSRFQRHFRHGPGRHLRSPDLDTTLDGQRLELCSFALLALAI